MIFFSAYQIPTKSLSLSVSKLALIQSIESLIEVNVVFPSRKDLSTIMTRFFHNSDNKPKTGQVESDHIE